MWLIAGQGLLLQQTWMELVCERMAEDVSSCWSHQQARFKRKTGQDPVMDCKMKVAITGGKEGGRDGKRW